MKPILLFIFISVAALSAQTELVKWDSQDISYELPAHHQHDYALDKSSFGLTILSVARNTYYYFVSDLDGDNCAFLPSCSLFFIQAVKETSIFKGTLMFADRFTRDINFFKGSNHYPLLPVNKFYDPAFNYTLHSANIKL
jgi:putative component of membrane protein insertase Oxa1/YidC/SpoIIIJ protein YidD